MRRLHVITGGNSPGERQHYTLLQSPITALPFRLALPFLVLSFLAGILLGLGGSGTWHAGRPASRSSANFQSERDAAASFPREADVAATDSRPLAWLMSFPNSGTSYTSLLVRTVTGKSTASNYGTEHVGRDGTSVGVFGDGPGGPFWTDTLRYARTESGYLLTKTHCGGRCNQCPVDKYVESQQTFARRCFEGYRVSKDSHGVLQEKLVSYGRERVRRAVHLIRDPFDNVVSRFHLARKQFVKRNETEALAKYPPSKDGFRAFCEEQGRRYRGKERESKFYEDVLDAAGDVPCHADFFRWVQWHNLAFVTTWDLRLPTLILHYENYTDDFNRTKGLLLDFLEQEDMHEPPAFETGKTYRDYFKDKEVHAVSSMFSKLAMAKTWDYTKHYFTM